MASGIIALYIRLSIEDEKNNSLSIPNQRLILNEKAASLPEYSDCEIMEFVDNGHSGTNFERPAMQKLLNMVRTGIIKCIIVKDFSRFGRNSIESGYFIEKVFPLYHIRFISVNDYFDTAELKGDTGGIDIAFKYFINECYSRDLSKKTKSAYQVRMKRGEFQNSNCPYGYVKGADGRLTPDSETADNVRMIFEWAAEGLNTSQIARKLYELHIPTPGESKRGKCAKEYDISRTNGIWLHTAVWRILSDERYTGTYVAGKSSSVKIGGGEKRYKDESEWIKIPNHHTPIISKELFELVKSKMGKGKKTSAPKPREYLLKGKVYCGCCDHALAVVHQYHYCKYSAKIQDMSCHGLKIYIKELEQVVFDTIRTQASVVIENTGAKDKITLLSSQQEEHGKRIKFLQDSRRELYEQYTVGELDIDTYKAKKSEIDIKLAHEKSVSETISHEAKSAQEDYKNKIQQKEVSDEMNAAAALTKSLVDRLVKKVYVFPGNRIEINYAVNFIGK